MAIYNQGETGFGPGRPDMKKLVIVMAIILLPCLAFANFSIQFDYTVREIVESGLHG